MEIKLVQAKRIISDNKLGIFGILETKLNLDFTLKAVKLINPLWSVHHNLVEAPYGRIMVISDPTIYTLTPIVSHKQFIHFHAMHIPSTTTFYLTFIYGGNHVAARQEMLNYLPHFRQETHPWFVLGDFNCMSAADDRCGGSPLTISNITPLNQAISSSNLHEAAFVGPKYTWNNKSRSGVRTMSRLDLTFLNTKALTQFPNALNHILPPQLFDHSLVFIATECKAIKMNSSFKFFNSWINDPEFMPLVVNVWKQPKFGNKMSILQQKLKATKEALKIWAKNKYGDGDKNSNNLQNQLSAIQLSMLDDPANISLSEQEHKLTQQLSEAMASELSMKKQKLRKEWDLYGDRNSKLYHSTLQVKNAKRNIH